jgi:hypothetical protein
MTRYIDADELRRRVKEKTNPYGKPTLDYESGVKVLNMIDNEPTADVVPKSEVEKSVVGYIEKHLQYQRKKIDVPFTSRDMRNYQCGAIDVIEYFEELLAELKKKYTEADNGV